MSKVLVCGGRDYLDWEAFCVAMARLPVRALVVIHGGATGADAMAARWAVGHGAHGACVSAQWDAHGRSAGPKRNEAMLLLQPDYCVALPGGRGTRGMCALAEAAGVPVWRPYG